MIKKEAGFFLTSGMVHKQQERDSVEENTLPLLSIEPSEQVNTLGKLLLEMDDR